MGASAWACRAASLGRDVAPRRPGAAARRGHAPAPLNPTRKVVLSISLHTLQYRNSHREAELTTSTKYNAVYAHGIESYAARK